MRLPLCILHTALPQAMPLGLLLSGIGFHYFFSMPLFSRLKQWRFNKSGDVVQLKEKVK